MFFKCFTCYVDISKRTFHVVMSLSILFLLCVFNTSVVLIDKENLCLYGLPNEAWEVNLPVEEVPPELPEPALGINFARDGMAEKDWLSLVAVHSDSWLLAVAFYFGARFGFGKNERYEILFPFYMHITYRILYGRRVLTHPFCYSFTHSKMNGQPC